MNDKIKKHWPIATIIGTLVTALTLTCDKLIEYDSKLEERSAVIDTLFYNDSLLRADIKAINKKLKLKDASILKAQRQRKGLFWKGFDFLFKRG